MGHRPPSQFAMPPMREEFHLATAKTQYVKGALDLDEYEAAVMHVLKGGTLTAAGHIPVEVEIHKNVTHPRLIADTSAVSLQVEDFSASE